MCQIRAVGTAHYHGHIRIRTLEFGFTCGKILRQYFREILKEELNAIRHHAENTGRVLSCKFFCYTTVVYLVEQDFMRDDITGNIMFL